MFRSLALVITLALATIGLSLTGAACGDLDRLTDCQQICERYGDCFDSTYDVATCRSGCVDSAENSSNFDQRVDNCENCLDDRSCSSAAFTCTAECVGIVP
jgi:hypothetical protein